MKFATILIVLVAMMSCVQTYTKGLKCNGSYSLDDLNYGKDDYTVGPLSVETLDSMFGRSASWQNLKAKIQEGDLIYKKVTKNPFHEYSYVLIRNSCAIAGCCGIEAM